MKQESKQTSVVLVALFVTGCLCAAAASVCRAMCHVAYLQLGAAASSPRQVQVT
jgi:hypothetical protein